MPIIWARGAGLRRSSGVIFKILQERGQMDNTVVFVSGDHGMGGMPHGKCNLYDFGTNVALVAAGPGIKGGRVLEDFVWLPDLAATFLETGGVKNPEGMAASGVWPSLRSEHWRTRRRPRTWVLGLQDA